MLGEGLLVRVGRGGKGPTSKGGGGRDGREERGKGEEENSLQSQGE